jgi:hypothetical protein
MKSKLFLFTFLLIVILYSCGRRNVPEKTPAPENNNVTIAPNDSAAVRKTVAKPKPRPKDIIPNTISVNDAAAHKSIDGRLYYDLLGHRYWKNYRDGKYYLFNKSMYSNPAFKAPK